FSMSEPKKTAAPDVPTWSPTVVLMKALTGLTMIDRTGNRAFQWIWPQTNKKNI
ncbi:hypothetical protein NADFUDRAFT_28178, partial [Nadsonia fulvescens var. elongata DSM 6958]